MFALLYMIAAVLMAEVIARFKPGDNVSVFAKKTLEPGRFVKVVGRTAKGSYEAEHGTSKLAPHLIFGVTQRGALEALDAAAQDRLVECVRNGSIARVETGEEIKAGEAVMCGANGVAMKSTENPVGIAVSTAASGKYVEVDLHL